MDRTTHLSGSPHRRTAPIRRGGYSKELKVSYGVAMPGSTPPSDRLTDTRSTARLKLERGSHVRASATGLVCPAPIEAFLAALSADIAYIDHRLPGSPELATLTRLRDELQQALDEARRRDVWLSPAEVATAARKGVSTVTKECRDHGPAVGAVRNGKRSWLIHWPRYEAWMQGLVAARSVG